MAAENCPASSAPRRQLTQPLELTNRGHPISALFFSKFFDVLNNMWVVPTPNKTDAFSFASSVSTPACLVLLWYLNRCPRLCVLQKSSARLPKFTPVLFFNIFFCHRISSPNVNTYEHRINFTCLKYDFYTSTFVFFFYF